MVMLFLWYSEGTKRNYRHFKSIFKKISLLCGYNFIMEIASLPLHCHFILFWIVLILVSGKRCYVPAKSSYFWQLIYPNNTHEHQNTDFFVQTCTYMYVPLQMGIVVTFKIQRNIQQNTDNNSEKEHKYIIKQT